MQSQLRWAGHVVRMKDYCLPKKMLYGELSQGKRSHEGQRKRFKYTLNVSIKSFGITSNSLAYLALDRDKRREVVKRGAKACEARRNAATEQHRKLRKDTATLASAATIPCSHCPRHFRTEIGLLSHLPIHGSRTQL